MLTRTGTQTLRAAQDTQERARDSDATGPLLSRDCVSIASVCATQKVNNLFIAPQASYCHLWLIFNLACKLYLETCPIER